MAEWCAHCRVEVWACCLMPNHAHLICVPRTGDSVRLAAGKAHLRYTRRVNFREGWEDFLSVPTRAEEARILSRHRRTGRPLGDADFVAHLERELGRSLVRGKPGRKPRGNRRI